MEDLHFVSADSIADQLAPALKSRGFRKRRLTWCKAKEDTTVLFHIQRSQWSRDVWYYIFGTTVNAYTDRPVTSCDHNHIQTRCDSSLNGSVLTAEQVLKLIDAWDESYGSTALVCKHLVAGTIPLESLGCAGYDALCALSDISNIPIEHRSSDFWFSDVCFAQRVLPSDREA